MEPPACWTDHLPPVPGLEPEPLTCILLGQEGRSPYCSPGTHSERSVHLSGEDPFLLSARPHRLLSRPPAHNLVSTFLHITTVFQEAGHTPQLLYDFPWSRISKVTFLVGA